MNDLFTQLTSLLTEAPGSLIFHLVLAFSVAGSLQVAFSHWRSSRFPQLRRTIIGLFALLFGQIVLFAVSTLSWQSLIDPAMVSPLDRAITLYSLIWIAWLWLFPEPNRPADTGNAFLNLLLIIGLLSSYASWMPLAATQTYNLTTQDIIWQFLSLGIIVIAGVMLVIRRPNGWNNGGILLGLALLGHSLHLLLGSSTGDFPGIVRLFYLAAFPTLLTLTQRFPRPAPRPAASHNTPTLARQTNGPVRERRRYSTDPRTFHALLSLAGEVDAQRINHAITRAIAQTMLADLCFLIYLSEDTRQMIIASGYDLIREENLEGSILNKEIVPMLANALQRGKALRLPQSSTSPDLQGLGELLHLANPGHLLCAPVLKDNKEPIGGVLLLSPYSNRLWNADDQAFLSNTSTALLSIIQRGQKLDEIKRGRERSQEVAEEYRLQIEMLRDEKNALSLELENIEKTALNTSAQNEDIEALLALQEETQNELAKLKQENEALSARNFIETEEKFKSIKSGGADYIERELRASLQEIAHLQNQQARTNQRILELESQLAKESHDEQAALIASMSQELRQPMSSILGYTDLLLGDTVGVLGALQRKFVERTKASIERMGSLIDNIVQVSTLEAGLGKLKSEPVDLNTIIDNAVAYTSNQMREKNISINLELPKTLPPIYTDKDALQQILTYLLQNAGATSFVDGTVTLHVQSDKEDKHILIKVSDTGGGIPKEDLHRVFSRLYRAENVLIQGVGDTGIGLSIAKTLTEAQKGRIWVTSEENIGATFSVSLPISSPDTVNET